MNKQKDLRRIVVVGGGITGLSAAHRLLELAREQGSKMSLTMLEARDRPGGVIATVRRDGYLCECGPESFVTNKPWGLDLCKRLGLESQLLATNDRFRRALVVRQGRLLPIPEGFVLMAPTKLWPMVCSPVFSWSGKMRMAMEIFARPRREVEDESVASFVTRHFGKEALERVVQPLFGGIYTADPNRLSLRATMPMFLEMQSAHGSVIRAMRRQSVQSSGARYGLFVTLRGGLDGLVDALVSQIGPTRIHLRKRVRMLGTSHDGQCVSIRLDDGGVLEVDGVIIAVATHASSAMLESVSPRIAAMLGAVPYASSAVIHFAFRRAHVPHPLDAFGFVVPYLERRSILAASFNSVKFGGRAPEGGVLIRAFVGGALQGELMQLDDESMVAAASKDLADLLGITEPPQWTMVYRWPDSMPQYGVGHVAEVAAMRGGLAEHPRLELAGNGLDGVGIPDCIHSGEQASERLWGRLWGGSDEGC